MPVNIIKKQKIVGKVETLDKDGEVAETEEIEVGEIIVDKPMANVGVKVGTTKNLGDYNSLRVDVSLFMPSETDKKSLNKTFKKCFKWCDTKLDEIVS
jgi:hypothetical protein